MNIFCNSEGVVFHVIADNIFQGSAGTNKIYFIGQFPASAQVLMSYHLPNGIDTSPKLLTYVPQAEKLQSSNGGLFSVWEGRIGATPKVENGEVVKDSDGNIVYDLDYTITENYGTAVMQFRVYGASRNSTVNGTVEVVNDGVLATAEVTFEIKRGVPLVLPSTLDESDDVETILTQILGVLSATKTAYDSIESSIGNPNGIATLDEDGRLPATMLPENLGNLEKVIVETIQEEGAKVYKDATEYTDEQIDERSIDVAPEEWVFELGDGTVIRKTLPVTNEEGNVVLDVDGVEEALDRIIEIQDTLINKGSGAVTVGSGTKLYHHKISGTATSAESDYSLDLIITTAGEQLTAEGIIAVLTAPFSLYGCVLSKYYNNINPIVTATQVGVTQVSLLLSDGTSQKIEVGKNAIRTYDILGL